MQQNTFRNLWKKKFHGWYDAPFALAKRHIKYLLEFLSKRVEHRALRPVHPTENLRDTIYITCEFCSMSILSYHFLRMKSWMSLVL